MKLFVCCLAMARGVRDAISDLPPSIAVDLQLELGMVTYITTTTYTEILGHHLCVFCKEP